MLVNSGFFKNFYHQGGYLRILTLKFQIVVLEKRIMKILATLPYKLLYNIKRSEKWGKKIQATAYYGTHTVKYLLVDWISKLGLQTTEKQ